MVDDNVVEGFDALEFLAGGGDAEFEFGGGFGLARREAAHQFILAFGGEEDEQGFGRQSADGLRALHVETHDHVLAAGEGVAHLFFGIAFVIAVDGGVFEKFILLDHARELFF